MKETVRKIRKIFDEYYFLRNECLIDSLMNIEKSYVCCKGCNFVWFAEKDGSCNICSYSLNIDLDEVI